jgi:hypothetical protein
MTTEELIRKAFADISYPGDDDIAHHTDCLECDEIRAYFRGKSWDEIKFPELREYQALALLAPAAFRYFLPGYMLATLSDWNEADMIPMGIVEGTKLNRSLFTRPQLEAIAAYVIELGKNGPLEWRDPDSIRDTIAEIMGDLSEETTT